MFASMKTKIPALALTLAVSTATFAASNAAQAGTLENLERERAILVQTFMNPTLDPEQRQASIASTNRRLVDLERMVLRDKSLRGKNTKVVRRAFRSYDVSFMAHASAEKNLTLVDNWMEQFGLSTETLMTAEIGRR